MRWGRSMSNEMSDKILKLSIGRTSALRSKLLVIGEAVTDFPGLGMLLERGGCECAVNRPMTTNLMVTNVK